MSDKLLLAMTASIAGTIIIFVVIAFRIFYRFLEKERAEGEKFRERHRKRPG
jgi:hypothetical protein